MLIYSVYAIVATKKANKIILGFKRTNFQCERERKTFSWHIAPDLSDSELNVCLPACLPRPFVNMIYMNIDYKNRLLSGKFERNNFDEFTRISVSFAIFVVFIQILVTERKP